MTTQSTTQRAQPQQTTQTATPFRFPDKPGLSIPYGQPIPPGQYLAQFKPDGERCIIRFERGRPLEIVSRFNRPLADAEQARKLAEPIRERLEYYKIGQATLDAEHVCNRRGAKREETKPAIWLLDCLEFEGEPLFGRSVLDRWQILRFMGCPVEILGAYWSFKGNIDFENNGVLLKPRRVRSWIDYAKHALSFKPELAIEGVVLKLVHSTLIGATRKSASNPAWIKVKW